MTTIKLLAALSFVAVLAACAGPQPMSFAAMDDATLHNIPTAPVAPLY